MCELRGKFCELVSFSFSFSLSFFIIFIRQKLGLDLIPLWSNTISVFVVCACVCLGGVSIPRHLICGILQCPQLELRMLIWI